MATHTNPGLQPDPAASVDPEVVRLDRPLTSDDVRPGVVFIKALTLPSHVSEEFVEHLRYAGASESVVAAAEAATE